MPSKFETVLIPLVAKVALAGSLLFVAVVCVDNIRVQKDPPPFSDAYSPDGLYVASLESHTTLYLTSKPEFLARHMIAQGADRIVNARWIAKRELEVDFIPSKEEFPIKRERWHDVSILYKPTLVQ